MTARRAGGRSRATSIAGMFCSRSRIILDFNGRCYSAGGDLGIVRDDGKDAQNATPGANILVFMTDPNSQFL